jgi:hypothetical protein
MIIPGTKSQVDWGGGSWAFLDIGFSSSARTCGLAIDQEHPSALTFADARSKLLEWLPYRFVSARGETHAVEQSNKVEHKLVTGTQVPAAL